MRALLACALVGCAGLLAGCPGPAKSSAPPPPWEQRLRLTKHVAVQVPTLEPVSIGVGEIDPTLHAVLTVTDGPRVLARGDLREGEGLRFLAAGRVHEATVTSYEVHRTHDDVVHLVVLRLPEGTPDPPPPADVAPIPSADAPVPRGDQVGPPAPRPR